jgi:hypothetical protein
VLDREGVMPTRTKVTLELSVPLHRSTLAVANAGAVAVELLKAFQTGTTLNLEITSLHRHGKLWRAEVVVTGHDGLNAGEVGWVLHGAVSDRLSIVALNVVEQQEVR